MENLIKELTHDSSTSHFPPIRGVNRTQSQEPLDSHLPEEFHMDDPVCERGHVGPRVNVNRSRPVGDSPHK